MIDVKIPVKPYVRKYLEKRYGTTHRASSTSFIGMLLLHFLEKTVQPTGKATGEESYSVEVPEYYVNTTGHTVPDALLHRIGDCLEKMFREELFAYLDVRVLSGYKAQPELNLFLKRYAITEDDLRRDSIYKAYQRHCGMKIKAKKNAA